MLRKVELRAYTAENLSEDEQVYLREFLIRKFMGEIKRSSRVMKNNKEGIDVDGNHMFITINVDLGGEANGEESIRASYVRNPKSASANG
jgi:hypothetical protein